MSDINPIHFIRSVYDRLEGQMGSYTFVFDDDPEADVSDQDVWIHATAVSFPLQQGGLFEVLISCYSTPMYDPFRFYLGDAIAAVQTALNVATIDAYQYDKDTGRGTQMSYTVDNNTLDLEIAPFNRQDKAPIRTEDRDINGTIKKVNIAELLYEFAVPRQTAIR